MNTSENIELAPISFTPYLKSVIWGGDKICTYKQIPQTEANIGESWEIFAVPGHESVVEGGMYAGMSLVELIRRFGDQLLGKSVNEKYEGKFPLLIKIIDANDNLSVQVHPDDALAKARHNSLGKTEMWYIIDANANSKIYSGFKSSINAAEYERKVADGSFTDVIAVHDSAPGDIFFLPAGRVHAIGAGNLLAEIQESSDITYRIFDYNRRDAKGKPRELHTELAKDAIDYTVHPDYKSVAPSTDIKDAEIAKCSHFNVHRILIDGKINLDLSYDSFTIIMCLEGNVNLHYHNGMHGMRNGHTVLLPALLTSLTVSGTGTLLLVHV